ncbi:hypothetical protein TNCV_1609091 [Trichonephila clavipes]|nr:hypothetical protein TNCV_1609091 [Trichonephila clavipes]
MRVVESNTNKWYYHVKTRPWSPKREDIRTGVYFALSPRPHKPTTTEFLRELAVVSRKIMSRKALDQRFSTCGPPSLFKCPSQCPLL